MEKAAEKNQPMQICINQGNLHYVYIFVLRFGCGALCLPTNLSGRWSPSASLGHMSTM